MDKHYSEYFSIKKDFVSEMTKYAIQATLDGWLSYYPHKTFVEILQELLAQLDGGNKSLWITGAYGTGKTHCALVLQKLFNDTDEERILKYFAENKELASLDTVKNSLLTRRKEKTLVVYDYGSAKIDANEQFLVRIEKTIISQLEESGYKIPAKGNFEEIKERVKKNSDYFFEERNSIQSKLYDLSPNIKNYDELEKAINNAGESLGGLLSDISRVFRKMDIYLNITPSSLKNWINDTLELNGIGRVIFIWDEFSDFVNENKAQLTTLQEVAEFSGTGKFFFIPITHLNLDAFVAHGSDNAKKIANRFRTKNIDMPMDTALKAAAKALNVNSEKLEEWEREREVLWGVVKRVAENIKSKSKDIEDLNDFRELLPIHPMTAIVLKHLSVAVGADQRSLFSFMAKSLDFREFIDDGGVSVENRQFLTIDYLWKYFVEENHDLGTPNEVKQAKSQYLKHEERIAQREDKRVLKAVLLLKILESKLDKDFSNELLLATVDNIKAAFRGDGAIESDIDWIIESLKSEHCFNVINGRIESFATDADESKIEETKTRLADGFSRLMLEEKTKSKIFSYIKDWNFGNRYEVRCFGIKEAISSNVKNKDDFSKHGNKILIQFVIAKDEEEQLKIADKIKDLTKQLSEYRIIYVFLDTTFCSEKSNQWDTYIEQLARLEEAKDGTTKTLHKKQITDIENLWYGQATGSNRKLTIYWNCDCDVIKSEEISWRQLREFVLDLTKKWFEHYTDGLADGNLTVFGNLTGLQNWAKAGILLGKFELSGSQKNFTQAYLRKGIDEKNIWFDENPQHSLTKMRDFAKKELEKSIKQEKNCSIRKIYIDLQRPPFGLLDVPHSAFILGFVLKEFLTDERNLQWTDHTISGILDINSLAEIIETAIKVDEKKKEKVICTISSEEKTFIDASSEMFSMQVNQGNTIELLLKEIAIKLESICDRVPLWILPEYIRDKQIGNYTVISEVIENLCLANSISSKGESIEQRGDSIKRIGVLISQNPSVASEISGILKPEFIENAFRTFVDEKSQDLKTKAINADDYSGQYYESIKSKFTQTASWLWKQQDVVPILNEVGFQYDIMKSVREFTNVTGFLSFDDAIDRLQKAFFRSNKVSLEILTSKYPVFERIFALLKSTLKGEKSVRELAESIKNQSNELKKVFFDSERKEQIAIAKKVLQDVWDFDPKEDKVIYDKFGDWANYSERDFKDSVLRTIEEFKGNLESEQKKKFWQNEKHKIKDKVEKITEKKAKNILLKLAEKNPVEVLQLLEDEL